MGTRPTLAVTLLCLILLATSLIQSCNKEPAPIAIDISQPTQQQPPTELWRKAVVTKPLTEEEKAEMGYMGYVERVKAQGWTLARSPIMLPDGDILVVSNNLSIDTTTPEFPDENELAGMFKEFCMHRLVIVSPSGKIRLHKEFRWDESAAIIPDPAAGFVALVAQSIQMPQDATKAEQLGKKTISALDAGLNIVWEFETSSTNVRTASFAANNSLMVWEGYGNLGNKSTKYPQSLYAMNRDGSVVWKHKLPDGDALGILKTEFPLDSPITFDLDGNAFHFQSDRNVYAIGSRGQLAWKKHLDYSFKSHPVLLPNGNLALVGDLEHQVEFAEFKSSNPGKKELERREDTRNREILSLPGYLFVLSSEGEVLLEKKLPTFPNSGPVVVDDTKLLLNIAGNIDYQKGTSLKEVHIPSRLMCVSIEGETLWDKAFDTGFAEGSILVVNHPKGDGKILLAAGDDGNLYALDEAGELLWVISGTGIDPDSLAVGTDGRMYVVDGSGELVCYKWEG